MNPSSHIPAELQDSFLALLSEAGRQFQADPALLRVICVMTAKGHACYAAGSDPWTPGDFRCEEICISQLQEAGETQVRCLAVLWRTEQLQPDAPSWYLCQRLLETDRANLDALVLLWTGIGDTYRAVPLRAAAPPRLVARFS